MNFLAHLYLSHNDPKIMVGNFIGDFVKGRNFQTRFEPGIVKGIELHRAIDAFTDGNEVVSESKNRLRPKYRHYATVIVDLFYDHHLAKNWNYFHPELLPDFVEKCYRIMEEHHDILPEETQYMLPHMIRGNWLVNYATSEGIHRALTGMSRRTKFNSKMDEALEDLITHYEKFESEFMRFFPVLSDYAKTFLKTSGL